MRIVSLKLLLGPEQIAARIRGLGEELNLAYEGTPLVMICVLKGSCLFFADLFRQMKVRPEMDFVRVASYGGGQNPQNIRLTKDVEVSLKDRHVLLVDDIVDTGRTLEFLVRHLRARGALSLRVAALLDKHERREADVIVDFCGFALDAGFIVGYGLDYAEQYRELPGIYEAVIEDQNEHKGA